MLKDNRGFSYVEVMTVCVILCIIVVVSYPIVMVTLKHSKENLYQENVASIERISLGWALEHVNELPDSNKDARFLTLKELEEEEYIKSGDLEDPRDNSIMDGCIKIQKGKNEQYEAKYYEKTCEVIGEKYLPRVKVVKSAKKNHQIHATEKYEYPELMATTILGETLEIPDPVIKCNGKKVKNLENKKLGTQCELIYQIQDPNNGLIKEKRFSISIVDTVAPQITVLDQEKGFTQELLLGQDYQIPKAKVTDNSNGKTKLKISTDLNLQQVGTYELVYTATDESDNLGVFIIKIKVLDNKALTENQVILNQSSSSKNGRLKKENDSTYIFQGIDPNNYVLYQKELWRILRLDQNGMKLVKNGMINKMAWSSNANSVYYNSDVKKLLRSYQGTFIEDVLNRDVEWNIGSVDLINSLPIDQIIKSETSLQDEEGIWVGLPQVSDYLQASSRVECLSQSSNCNLDNYLSRSYRYFTAHAMKDGNKRILVGTKGLELSSPFESVGVVPVIYLKGYKTVQGTGTLKDPYTLVYP